MFCALIQALSISTDTYYFFQILYQSTSVAQSCPTPCDTRDCSTPGFPVHHQLPEPSQSESVMPSNHLIIYRFLLLLPSIFPSIRVFSDESIVCSWSKYWSFSFSISPSNEYSGLISFGIDWFDLLAIQRTIKYSPTPQFKSINSSALNLLYGPILTFIHDYWKNYSFD